MKSLFSKPKVLSIGANAHIKSQLNSLNIEKEILTKTISRLYQHEVGLSKIQRDRLLIRYQHQLGVVLAKIEKMEAASKHPDLGPLGDGLITLMDQKLSQLDKRLYELSSKINVANTQNEEIKSKSEAKVKEEIKKPETPQVQRVEVRQPTTPAEIIQQKPSRPVELTTLTEIPAKAPEFPLIEQKPRDIQMEIIQERIDNQPQKVEEKVEILQASVTPNVEKTETRLETTVQETLPTPVENKPKPTIKLPEEDSIEDEDDDDLDSIKGEIMKTLSKLDQAEVE